MKAPPPGPPQCAHQQHRVGGGEGEQVDAEGRGQHQDAKHPASAVAIGPDTQKQPADGAGKNRRCHQQAQLGVGQPEILADADADDRENGPHREAQGERKCGQTKRPILLGSGRDIDHGVLLVWPVGGLRCGPPLRLGLLAKTISKTGFFHAGHWRYSQRVPRW